MHVIGPDSRTRRPSRLRIVAVGSNAARSRSGFPQSSVQVLSQLARQDGFRKQVPHVLRQQLVTRADALGAGVPK
jgi:hypothetical protein